MCCVFLAECIIILSRVFYLKAHIHGVFTYTEVVIESFVHSSVSPTDFGLLNATWSCTGSAVTLARLLKTNPGSRCWHATGRQPLIKLTGCAVHKSLFNQVYPQREATYTGHGIITTYKENRWANVAENADFTRTYYDKTHTLQATH